MLRLLGEIYSMKSSPSDNMTKKGAAFVGLHLCFWKSCSFRTGLVALVSLTYCYKAFIYTLIHRFDWVQLKIYWMLFQIEMSKKSLGLSPCTIKYSGADVPSWRIWPWLWASRLTGLCLHYCCTVSPEPGSSSNIQILTWSCFERYMMKLDIAPRTICELANQPALSCISRVLREVSHLQHNAWFSAWHIQQGDFCFLWGHF